MADLIAGIERSIDAWNDRYEPVTWIKAPDTIIAKATDQQHDNTPTTSDTQH
ncbi:hypothetical protein [Geodermatophilus sp. URMC 63]